VCFFTSFRCANSVPSPLSLIPIWIQVFLKDLESGACNLPPFFPAGWFFSHRAAYFCSSLLPLYSIFSRLPVFLTEPTALSPCTSACATFSPFFSTISLPLLICAVSCPRSVIPSQLSFPHSLFSKLPVLIHLPAFQALSFCAPDRPICSPPVTYLLAPLPFGRGFFSLSPPGGRTILPNRLQCSPTTATSPRRPPYCIPKRSP